MENKEQIKKPQSSTTKKNIPPKVRVRTRNKKGLTVAIIALSVLLGLSLVFGITAAFFTNNQTANGTVTLGNPVNIAITQGGTSVEALTFSGTAMPGTVYDQVIGISVPASSSDCVVRGKLTITNTGSATVNVQASTDSNWTLGTDDYYYYNGVLSAGDTAAFVNSITVPKTLVNADANKTFALSIQIEAIQFANGAASEVWTTAPSAWTTNYGSGTLPSGT